MKKNPLIKLSTAMVLASGLLLLGGCADGVEVAGVTSTTQDVILVWQVSSGSPDYLYKFGEGTADGAAFELSIGDDPPEEALNASGVGIAFVVALPEGMAMPADGKLDTATSDALTASDNVISDRQAVIFNKEGATGTGWSEGFDAGYSCGQCIDAPEGETFDSFEPAECDAVELRKASEGKVCNWT